MYVKLQGGSNIIASSKQSQANQQRFSNKLFKEELCFVCIFHEEKEACDSQCGASRSLRDQRSCPP